MCRITNFVGVAFLLESIVQLHTLALFLTLYLTMFRIYGSETRT